MTQAPSHTLLNSVRFEPERAMQTRLRERFGVAEALKAVPEDVRHQFARRPDQLRARHTRLTPRIAPGLTAILSETMERLELEGKVELYIDASPEVNAYAYCSYGDDATWLVGLTSGAVHLLSDDHLRFTLGHELGHHAFGHGEFREELLMIYRDIGKPDLLESRIRVLERLQELSADRAGCLAVGGDMSISAEALLRIDTGLGPEDLRLDLEALLEEFDRLQSFDNPDQIGFETHPLLPLRIRGLQLHLEAADREEEILALSRLMDFEGRDESFIRERDLLLAGGLLAAHSDGDEELSDDERSRLVDLILPFTDDPEGHLNRLEDHEQAGELYIECATWVRENLGPQRYMMFDKLVEVVLFDNKVTEGEREFLLAAAEHLGIPVRYVEERLAQHALDVARQAAPPRPIGLRQRVRISQAPSQAEFGYE